MDAVTALASLAGEGNKGADRELTKLAASGDTDAQRALLSLCLGDNPYILTFGEAARLEMLARFVALHTSAAFDVRRLAAILWQMGRTDPDEHQAAWWAADAVNLLRALADSGDGVANDNLATLAKDFPDQWESAESAPPPIVRTNCGPSLGDLLAEAFERSGRDAPSSDCGEGE